jgi:hypothetical protein
MRWSAKALGRAPCKRLSYRPMKALVAACATFRFCSLQSVSRVNNPDRGRRRHVISTALCVVATTSRDARRRCDRGVRARIRRMRRFAKPSAPALPGTQCRTFPGLSAERHRQLVAYMPQLVRSTAIPAPARGCIADPVQVGHRVRDQGGGGGGDGPGHGSDTGPTPTRQPAPGTDVERIRNAAREPTTGLTYWRRLPGTTLSQLMQNSADKRPADCRRRGASAAGPSSVLEATRRWW